MEGSSWYDTEGKPTREKTMASTAGMLTIDSQTDLPAPPVIVPPIASSSAASSSSRRRWTWKTPIVATGSAIGWLFGLVSLIGFLAVLATIPVLQLASLGYLFEISGRIVRSGRLRDGLIGIRKAGRLGGIVLGTALLLIPIRLVASLWYSASLIAPDATKTAVWEAALWGLSVVLTGQILWAWYRGGRLRDFFWPAPLRLLRFVREKGKWASARDRLWDFAASYRFGHYFRLGFVGFFGTLMWLVVPVTLLVVATTDVGDNPDAAAGLRTIEGLVGSLGLSLLVLGLPLLQAHYGAEGRARVLGDVAFMWRTWGRAPIASAIAVVLTLALSIPLYLAKVELPPQQAAPLLTVIFVLFILPARFAQGWAVSRAWRRERPARWWRRLLTVVMLLPAGAAALTYTVFVFFSRYTSWYGVWSLFEQHAFLLPVPFWDWGG